MNQQLFLTGLSAVALCLFPMVNSHAAAFKVTDGSKLYDAVITVAQCEKDTCSGTGKISLYTKGSKQLVQQLASEDLYFYLQDKQQPSVNVIQLYDEQSPLIFDDFNFDGQQDLAIRNGNNSSYGGPSYDVYVFNKTRKKFVLSDELTTLAVENLGMFQTDHQRKRLITFAKSGCCYHETSEYTVVPGKGLQMMQQLIEDATGAAEQVKVTTRILVNNHWQQTVKRYNINDYYKN